MAVGSFYDYQAIRLLVWFFHEKDYLPMLVLVMRPSSDDSYGRLVQRTLLVILFIRLTLSYTVYIKNYLQK